MSNQKAVERLILKRSTAFNCQRWEYTTKLAFCPLIRYFFIVVCPSSYITAVFRAMYFGSFPLFSEKCAIITVSQFVT